MSPVFVRESSYVFKIFSERHIKKIVEKHAERFKEQYKQHIGKRLDD
jgi:hypothetical protein